MQILVVNEMHSLFLSRRFSFVECIFSVADCRYTDIWIGVLYFRACKQECERIVDSNEV